MSELQFKEEIKFFIQENINETKFNKNKVCDKDKYKKVIKNTLTYIDEIEENDVCDVQFHMMLCKYIKEGKIKLVDEEYFDEKAAQSFVYNENTLSIIHIE
jgi:hypothetical protein